MKSRVVATVLGIVLLVGIVYQPVLSARFVTWDDDQYITENPWVQHGVTRVAVMWAFKTDYLANWHPLTWLSHLIDIEFFGLEPRGHHMTSLFLHVASSVLLFLVLQAYGCAFWASALTAALFGVHPLHVESVAWVSERKDVLSALFFFLGLGAYRRYTRAPGMGRYFLVLAVFAFGLMAKPMLVTFPFVLLLLDFWPLGRIGVSNVWSQLRFLTIEKIPLFLLAAASSTMTIIVQRPALADLEAIPALERVANALVSNIRYLGKTVFPRNLSCFYPFPSQSWSFWQVSGAGVLLLVITLLVLHQIRKHPYLVVGWFWYLGTLVPVIGLVQVGHQSMADRYTYLPLIGIFLALASSVAKVNLRRRDAILTGVGAAVVVAVLTLQGRAQSGYWHDDTTLYGHALEVNSNNWLIRNNLGKTLARSGRIHEAEVQFRTALQLNPEYAKIWYNLGKTLEVQRKYEDSIVHFTHALALKEKYVAAHSSLGAVLLEVGRNREAVEHLHEAIRLHSNNADTLFNLGLAYKRLGDRAAAERWHLEALRLRPDYLPAAKDLAEIRNRKEGR